MKVLCILTNGFEELEALGTIALLRRAKIDVTIASFPTLNITGSHNININTDIEFENIKNFDDYDMLFVAGGSQYKVLEKDEKFLNTVKLFHSKDKYISAICAGPTILGKLGLLKNKKYTCFSSMNEDFGGEYIDDYVVIDEKIITAKSAAAPIELAFSIINVLLGKETEENVKNQIYYYSKK